MESGKKEMGIKMEIKIRQLELQSSPITKLLLSKGC